MTFHLVVFCGYVCRWDEWVDENRLVEVNDLSVQDQKKLTTQHGAKNKEGNFSFLIEKKERCVYLKTIYKIIISSGSTKVK